VEFDEPRARALAARALERGLLINDVTPSATRLAPPLVITDDDVDEALSILAAVAAEA
jgi:acetylornithine/N-succinyldiaminopimelate aminotransferase